MAGPRRAFRRFASAWLAVLVAAPLVAIATESPAAGAGTPLYPDLKTLPPRELRFDRADVTPELSGVYHNVLRFSNDTYNAGDGPLILNATINPSTLSGPSTQRVMNSDGTFTDIPLNNDMYWHAAHHHYHFDNWGDYQLWTKTGYDAWIASGRTSGSPIYFGDKTTSCVTDEEFITNTPANVVYPGQYGAGGCDLNSQNQLHMGLAVGWGDTYDWYRQLQWIDLGQDTLGNGTYVLRSVADPLNIVYESAGKADPSRESVSGNEATTTFVVSNGAILDSDPPTGTVTINNTNASTSSASVNVSVIARDDVSEPNQFRLSNDGNTWKTFNYTSSGSAPTTVSWNLTDATAGGNSSGGIKTVYAQAHDNSGKWGPTFTDTINYTGGTGPPPPPPPPPSGPYATVVAGDGPGGYWRLDETSGTTAADSVGQSPGVYKNGVSLGQTSLLASDPDKAAGFNGTNQSVGINSTGAISPANVVSLEAWIKPTSVPTTGFRSVASKPESYSLQFNSGKMEFTIIQSGTRRRLQAPAGAVVAGSTYHVVGTYDGSTQRLYINGTLVASAALTGAISVNTNALNIGSWDGSSEFFAGTIDEVAEYPTVLTATQVTNHYSAGITTAPPPSQAQLSVSRSGTGNGTVTSSPAGINCGATCSAGFPSPTTVTLTATPAAGSTFTGWSGAGCSGTGTCVINLSSNTTVDAQFTALPPVQLSVTKSGTGSGTITSSPAGINCGATCSANFPSNSTVTLTASANAGSAFTGWSGGGCSGTGTCVVSLTSATSVNAGFDTVPTSQLSVTKSGSGSGTVTSNPSGINCGATCSGNFPTGNSVTLTATAAAGSAFTGWTGGGCSGTGTCVVSLSANTTVDAGFGTASQSSYQQVVTNDAPAGYWRLNETSGTTAANSAGAANNGTYTNVTLNQPGLLASTSNRAASFSGTNSRVQVASNAALQLTSRVSLEAWIKPNAIPASGFASVLTKAESYSLQFNSGKMEFTIMQSGTRRRLQAPLGAVAVGGVYHVVGTYDGTTQRLYINGTQVASASLTGAITSTTNSLYVGSWNGTSEFFNGTIDEPAVYPTVLNATQVSNHYTTGSTSLVSMLLNAPDVRLVAAGGVSAHDAGNTPVGSAFDEGLHRLYVAGTLGHGLSARNGVTVFDMRTGRVVRRVKTGGSGAPSIAVDPVRHLVYVTSAVFDPTGVHGSVKVLDGRTGRIVRSIDTGPGPKAVAVNPKTGRAYVTAATGIDGSSAVMVIDHGRITATIPIGPFERYYDNPFGLAVDTATNTVYASNPLDGFVYAIDGATNGVVRSIGIGGEPTALGVNARTGRVYVATARRLVVIDGVAGVVTTRVSLGSRPRGVAVDAARGVVYATTSAGDVVAIASGGARVVAHAVKPNGVTVANDGRVAVADASRRAVVLLGRDDGGAST